MADKAEAIIAACCAALIVYAVLILGWGVWMLLTT